MYKALFVDDNKIQIKSLLNYISWDKFGVDEIKIAYDAFDAISICKNFVPDILITDIVMPDMNGIELVEKLKEMNINPQYIYISCYEEVEFLKSAINNNAVGYIVKPLRPEELENVVRKACNNLKLIKNDDSKRTEHIGSFRENFICRLLNSFDISNEEIRDMAAGLGIDKYHNYTVAAIEYEQDMSKRFLNIKSKLIYDIKKNENVIVYGDLTDRIVILYMDNNDSQNLLYEQLSKIVREFYNTYHIAFYSGISSTVNSITDFKMMYAQVERVILYNKAQQINEVVTYFNLFNKTKYFDFTKYSINLRDIILLKSSKNKIDTFISQLKNEIDVCAGNIFMELYIYTLSELNKIFAEMDLTIKQVFGNINFSTKNETRFENSDIFFMWLYNIISNSKEYIYKYKNSEQFRISEKIMHYVTENFQTIKTIEDVAVGLNISYSYARAMFKKETGMTILDYLTFVRIEFAKRLFRTENYSVSEVAEKVGYNDVAYFRVVFKKNIGITPQEFKDKRLNK